MHQLLLFVVVVIVVSIELAQPIGRVDGKFCLWPLRVRGEAAAQRYKCSLGEVVEDAFNVIHSMPHFPK